MLGGGTLPTCMAKSHQTSQSRGTWHFKSSELELGIENKMVVAAKN